MGLPSAGFAVTAGVRSCANSTQTKISCVTVVSFAKKFAPGIIALFNWETCPDPFLVRLLRRGTPGGTGGIAISRFHSHRRCQKLRQ